MFANTFQLLLLLVFLKAESIKSSGLIATVTNNRSISSFGSALAGNSANLWQGTGSAGRRAPSSLGLKYIC